MRHSHTSNFGIQRRYAIRCEKSTVCTNDRINLTASLQLFTITRRYNLTWHILHSAHAFIFINYGFNHVLFYLFPNVRSFCVCNIQTLAPNSPRPQCAIITSISCKIMLKLSCYYTRKPVARFSPPPKYSSS